MKLWCYVIGIIWYISILLCISMFCRSRQTDILYIFYNDIFLAVRLSFFCMSTLKFTSLQRCIIPKFTQLSAECKKSNCCIFVANQNGLSARLIY
jgi:hypothetical protein